MATLSQRALDAVLKNFPENAVLRKAASKDFVKFLAANFTLTKEQKRAFGRIPKEEFIKLGKHMSQLSDGGRFAFDVDQVVSQVPPEHVFDVAELKIRLIIVCVTTTIDGRFVSRECKVIGVEIIWGAAD